MIVQLEQLQSTASPLYRVTAKLTHDDGTPDVFDMAFAVGANVEAEATAEALARRQPRPAYSVTQMHVVKERERRLSLGFTYNFGDARGSHHIGTTEADIKGWSEVSDYADALLAMGDTTTKIDIVTNTGPCQITAPEWMAIKLAAAAFRQPIWAKSFVLMASNPIPADYADNAHWS